MKTTMLEYSKLILRKVSFDNGLFEKELKKSLAYLKPEEIGDLLNWIRNNYMEYADIVTNIQDLFK